MSEMIKKLWEASTILSVLGVLIFSGIVWLILFGNLSGNLGFSTGSQGYNDTQTVIQNGTLGFKTFFGNMPTIFQIAAVVLLITMVVGLLFLIIAVVKKLNSSDGFGGGSGFSGYN